MTLTLRVLSGALAGQELVLDKSIVVAGRHPLCDLRFDAERDRDVSARHAEIRAAGEAWVVRDLGSTNGTFLNDAPMAPNSTVALRDRTRIRLGNVLIFFRHITQTTRL
jgi:pSer/pThr/pTyr-binding forkhead associated (FHA) protein